MDFLGEVGKKYQIMVDDLSFNHPPPSNLGKSVPLGMGGGLLHNIYLGEGNQYLQEDLHHPPVPPSHPHPHSPRQGEH